MPDQNLTRCILAAALLVAAPPVHGAETLPGEQVFSERCAQCHSSEVIEPKVAGLAKLTPEDIYRSLWSGVMREAAVGLNDAERWAVARYLGGLTPEKPSAKVSNFCDAEAQTHDGVAGSWAAWAPDARNSRHLSGSGLTAAQVAHARLKWAFVIPDTGSTTNAGNQPTVHDGRLYVGSRSGFVFALDARSGCIHWLYRPAAGVRSAIVVDDGKAIFADYLNYVYAVEFATGKLIWRNKADEQPSARMNGSVTVYDGKVFVPVSTNQGFVNALDPKLPCCTFQGTVTAFDTGTGSRLWQTRIVEEPIRELGRSPTGTMRYGPSGGSVWSVPTVDARRRLLYCDRGGLPAQVSATSICCVVAQAVRDRDIGAPVVLQTRSDGIEILLVASKDGMLYALDPDQNGEVIWETRVGRIIQIRGPSFGGVEHGIAADAERAYVPIADIDVIENTAAGALVPWTSARGKSPGAPTRRTTGAKASRIVATHP